MLHGYNKIIFEEVVEFFKHEPNTQTNVSVDI